MSQNGPFCGRKCYFDHRYIAQLAGEVYLKFAVDKPEALVYDGLEGKMLELWYAFPAWKKIRALFRVEPLTSGAPSKKPDTVRGQCLTFSRVDASPSANPLHPWTIRI